MAIVTVSTSNTFNEWRVVTNQLVTEVNKTESGTAALSVDTLTANTVTANGDIAVNGGDLTTTSATFNVANSTATTVNVGGAATTLNLGASSGTTTIRNDASVSGNTSITGTLGVTGNVTLSGELRGPSTFTIDPAVVGDDTGTVVIKGNLQVDGTTTTINSTTLTVDDKNIVIASGAADAAAANGAGITIDGASATITYLSSGDKFKINKALELDSTLTIAGNTNFDTGTLFIDTANDRVGIGTTSPSVRLHVNLSSSSETDVARFQASNGADIQFLDIGSDPTNNQVTFDVTGSSSGNYVFRSGGSDRVVFTSSGHVGIGTTSPRYNTTGATAGETTLTIFNSAQNGGGIELASATTTNTAAIGRLSWINTNNTDGTRAVAWIDALVSGTTSGAQGGSMRFGTKEDNTAHSIKMVITGAGNVGISQALPTQKLSVVGTANSAYTSASGIVLDYQSSTVDVTYPIGFAWSSSIGTQASYWGMGLIPVTFASGTAHLGFYTQGVERMRISGGSLGLGTTSPTARLHVVDSGTANTSITEVQRLFYAATTTPAVGYGAGIALYTANADLPSGSQTRVVIAGIAESVTNTSEKTALVVTTPASAGSGSQTERFRITSDGNVGIGITNPLSKLDVSGGQIRVRSSGTYSEPADVAGVLAFDSVGGQFAISARSNGGDTFTSFYTSAGGTGGERVRITSAGRVAIGTTNISSPSYALDVGDTAGGNMIRFTRSTSEMGGFISSDTGFFGSLTNHPFVLMTNSTTRIRILSSGEVGIGNTNPGQVLSIAGATDGKGLGFGGATNNYGNIFGSYSSGDMMIATGLQGNTTVEGVTSSFGDGSMYRSAIRLSAFGGRGIEFFTNDTSTVAKGTAITPNVRMKIATDGKVGIGTTAPNSIFHVSTPVDNGPGSATRISTGFGAGRVVLHNQDNAGTGNKMGLVFAHAGDPGVAAVIASYKESGTWRTGFQFYTNAQTGGDVDGITERMRLTADGRLGIGTTNPEFMLDVTQRTRLGVGVAQAAPSSTDIASTATLVLSGMGGNYLSFGQYGSNLAQWIQSSYFNPTTAVYPISLNPLGGNVGIGTLTPNYKLVVSGGSGMGFQMENTSDDGRGFRILTTGPTDRNVFITTTSSLYPMRFGIDSVERMRIDTAGRVGIGTTNPTYGLHVTSTTSLEAARNIYVPHSGISGGYGAESTNKIHIGSYFDLQHFSFTNAPALLFNASIKRSDFVGSGTGTASSFNVIEPYYNGGNYSLISTVNGGISFNIGSWGGNSEIDLGDISNHSSYKGGHDGNSFVIRATGANGLNMRPDAGDSNNSARAFFVNSGTTWAIMNNSGNLSFRSGATVGSDSGTQKMYIDTSGNMTISGVLTENSSIALKENVNPITNALDYISQLVGVTYDRKDGSAKNRAGLIKEEVEKVLPNVVNDNGIQYTNIIAYLVESIKDLKKEIEDLKKG